ncbi:cobalt-precorrin-6Y C(5)-methyltransferase [Halosimplex carlsbadense 2-9-1]|uniref:Cobalt-precorrin-6Y C(5)-methyltransferase n=1 Tax=Halosimplex carlsbadense 2-9-1 TaxID=797114 RepID=M0CZ53_9EURY|nr:cobalt-precorrin-7 (C(5))-methyltransferase [Halosimplex carlsbadense]ELZ27717.1 cobalt-precorrin-6Y C(5)-methyltransferase [Halosimplex carlsbadense 2-9-1]
MTDTSSTDDDRPPEAVAAAAPEPPDAAADRTEAAEPVHAVGIGPGNPEYLSPRAERAIWEADAVVGFETVVDHVRDRIEGTALACGYDDQSETLRAFGDRVADGAAGTAVLMGDPNFSGYQFLGRIERAVDPPVRVVPGISALQVAASRARTPMEASTFVTLHKRGDLAADRERLRAAVGDRHLLVLPRPYDLMPGDVAADLCDAGADESLTAIVYERLTYDDETVTPTTLGDLATRAGGNGPDDTPFSDLSVLVVRAADGPTDAGEAEPTGGDG